MTTIDLNEKKYFINFDAVFDLIEYSSKNERVETEITDGYEVSENDKTLSQVSKIVRESKYPPESQRDNIRYDFVKYLISIVIENEDAMPDVGTEICIATLIKHGILVEYTN